MPTVSQKILTLLTVASEASDSALEELIYPHRYIHSTFKDRYHVDSIYKALRKLLAREHIVRFEVKGKNHLRLTEKGRRQILSKVPVFRRMQEVWDGYWRLVLFDVPEEKRHRRDYLRRMLKELGFGQWQRSVWLSPFKAEESLVDFFEERPHYREYVEVLKARRVWAESEKDLANEIWKLERLHHQYGELVLDWETAFEEYEADFTGLAKLAAQLQERYVTLLLSDPGLPPQLLPDNWQANKAKKFFLEWKTILEKYV